MKKIIKIMLFLSVFWGLSFIASAAEDFTLTYTVEDVHVQKVDGNYYLFLPASADLTDIQLDFGTDNAIIYANQKSTVVKSNQSFNLKQLIGEIPEDGIYKISVNSVPVNIMHSENIAAVYLKSESDSKDRIWVEKSKDNKAKGSMRMINADGDIVYDGGLKQIKGRGNSTWTYVKKPYQIKLSTATDLMETGNSDEINTTWVLLANYKDMSLLKNQVTFAIADKMGLCYTPNCRQVDLYYDGEYRGVYLMTEKTEVGKGRVDIENLEEELENGNSDIDDFDALKENRTVNSIGNKCKYIEGLKSASDMTGGYLLEMDYYERALEEKSWFLTSKGQAIVSKSPEYLNSDGMEYISGLYQQYEDAIYNGGTDPKTGKDYRDIVDVNSLAEYYIIEELSQDTDAFCSSTFLYKKSGLNQKLYYGPVWDFDIGYGFFSNDKSCGVTGLGAAKTKICKALLSIPSFQETVKKTLNSYSKSIYDAADEISEMSNEISAAVRMNSILWPENTVGNGYSEQMGLKEFIKCRLQYLSEEISSWDGSPVVNPQFFDVPVTAWYSEDVEYATSNGIFSGTSAGYFTPEGFMTRAMCVQVMYNIYGCPSVFGNTQFSDVSQESWYSDAVTWAAQNNIVKGTTKTDFSPDNFITRQDFATILYRCWGNNAECELTSSAPDVNNINEYAIKSMAWAIANGIIKGDKNGCLRPDNSIVRSEAAAIVHRCEDKINYVRSMK